MDWKSSKEELHNKIVVLNAQNKALRTQVSQQRAIIAVSKCMYSHYFKNNISFKVHLYFFPIINTYNGSASFNCFIY